MQEDLNFHVEGRLGVVVVVILTPLLNTLRKQQATRAASLCDQPVAQKQHRCEGCTTPS